MPEWLLKNDNYTPHFEKDTFINKTVMALLLLISRLRTQSEHFQKKSYININLKVASAFFLIILVSTSKSFLFIGIISVYFLVHLSLIKGQDIIIVLKISLIVALFTMVILIPSVIQGNYYSIVMITSKVFLTVMSINILSRTSNWHSVTAALRKFFVPDIFILVLDITIKYITMLGEFSLEMLYALRLRSVGKNKDKHTSLSGIVGTMFIKSTEMAQEMYMAMECRGFSGSYKLNQNNRISVFDILFVSLNIGMFFIYLYLK